MRKLLNYMEKTYGVSRPGDIKWSHAVNSQKKLERCLKDASIMLIESDIRLSSTGVPIAAHPPETESDLSFEILIDKMLHSPQGLKLDFKDPEILTPCLERLRNTPLNQPVLLNADILQGNGASLPKFEAVGFIHQCREIYPSGILSLGWTTTANPDLEYTPQNIDEMLSLCRGIEEVTFPVRACLLPKSGSVLDKLIEREGYTLSIWNNEPISEELLQWIKKNTRPDKTFYDFIDDSKEPLNLFQ